MKRIDRREIEKRRMIDRRWIDKRGIDKIENFKNEVNRRRRKEGYRKEEDLSAEWT
jgi:hypothetical protein